MTERCEQLSTEYRNQINEIVGIQKGEAREAIFFIYADGSTSRIFKGDSATGIRLNREEISAVLSRGKLVGSIHSHPTGFEPSTVDLMTGIVTQQQFVGVAVPNHDPDFDSEFVLTVLDLSQLGFINRQRFMRSIRRTSFALTDIGRQLRKQITIQRFDVDGCRTHEVEIDGIEFPVADRPSIIRINLGDVTGVRRDSSARPSYADRDIR